MRINLKRAKVKRAQEPTEARGYLSRKYEGDCPLKTMVDDMIDQKEERLSISFIADVIRSREKIVVSDDESPP